MANSFMENLICIKPVGKDWLIELKGATLKLETVNLIKLLQSIADTSAIISGEGL